MYMQFMETPEAPQIIHALGHDLTKRTAASLSAESGLDNYLVDLVRSHAPQTPNGSRMTVTPNMRKVRSAPNPRTDTGGRRAHGVGWGGVGCLGGSYWVVWERVVNRVHRSGDMPRTDTGGRTRAGCLGGSGWTTVFLR